jgi:hypothetical protein
MRRCALKRRRDTRGAAMVEALVVIPAFVVVFISLLYMRGVYDARLESMRSARRDVWQTSLAACGGGSGAGGGADGSLDAAAGYMSSAKRVAQGRTLTKPLETGLSTGEATASASARGHETAHGMLEGLSMTTKNQVICNEKQADVSRVDILRTIDALYPTLAGSRSP